MLLTGSLFNITWIHLAFTPCFSSLCLIIGTILAYEKKPISMGNCRVALSASLCDGTNKKLTHLLSLHIPFSTCVIICTILTLRQNLHSVTEKTGSRYEENAWYFLTFLCHYTHAHMRKRGEFLSWEKEESTIRQVLAQHGTSPGTSLGMFDRKLQI